MRVLVDPLFYESLSGEFTLNGNINQRQSQSLGKLAFEAVDKGEQIRCINNDRHTEYFFRPEWAPKVLAKVTCVEDILETVSEISELSLFAPSRELTFQNSNMHTPDMPGVVIMHGKQRRTYNIHLGDGMKLAKAEIAFIAQALLSESSTVGSNENI